MTKTSALLTLFVFLINQTLFAAPGVNLADPQNNPSPQAEQPVSSQAAPSNGSASQGQQTGTSTDFLQGGPTLAAAQSIHFDITNHGIYIEPSPEAGFFTNYRPQFSQSEKKALDPSGQVLSWLFEGCYKFEVFAAVQKAAEALRLSQQSDGKQFIEQILGFIDDWSNQVGAIYRNFMDSMGASQNSNDVLKSNTAYQSAILDGLDQLTKLTEELYGNYNVKGTDPVLALQLNGSLQDLLAAYGHFQTILTEGADHAAEALNQERFGNGSNPDPTSLILDSIGDVLAWNNGTPIFPSSSTAPGNPSPLSWNNGTPLFPSTNVQAMNTQFYFMVQNALNTVYQPFADIVNGLEAAAAKGGGEVAMEELSLIMASYVGTFHQNLSGLQEKWFTLLSDADSKADVNLATQLLLSDIQTLVNDAKTDIAGIIQAAKSNADPKFAAAIDQAGSQFFDIFYALGEVYLNGFTKTGEAFEPEARKRPGRAKFLDFGSIFEFPLGPSGDMLPFFTNYRPQFTQDQRMAFDGPLKDTLGLIQTSWATFPDYYGEAVETLRSSGNDNAANNLLPLITTPIEDYFIGIRDIFKSFVDALSAAENTSDINDAIKTMQFKLTALFEKTSAQILSLNSTLCGDSTPVCESIADDFFSKLIPLLKDITQIFADGLEKSALAFAKA